MSKGGFDFSNVVRNTFLETKGIPLPKATSTGTTIVGCLFADGIVLGADTRATSGPIVADKNCEKVSVFWFRTLQAPRIFNVTKSMIHAMLGRHTRRSAFRVALTEKCAN